MTQIQRACSMEETRLDPNFYAAPTFHTVSFQDTDYQTIEFDVLSGWVSFHNAPHWLLAELLKQASLLESQQADDTNRTILQSAIAEKFDDAAILQVIEFPLRGKFVSNGTTTMLTACSISPHCPSESWSLGEKRIPNPRPTCALPRLYAPRALL